MRESLAMDAGSVTHNITHSVRVKTRYPFVPPNFSAMVILFRDHFASPSFEAKSGTCNYVSVLSTYKQPLSPRISGLPNNTDF